MDARYEYPAGSVGSAGASMMHMMPYSQYPYSPQYPSAGMHPYALSTGSGGKHPNGFSYDGMVSYSSQWSTASDLNYSPSNGLPPSTGISSYRASAGSYDRIPVYPYSQPTLSNSSHLHGTFPSTLAGDSLLHVVDNSMYRMSASSPYDALYTDPTDRVTGLSTSASLPYDAQSHMDNHQSNGGSHKHSSLPDLHKPSFTEGTQNSGTNLNMESSEVVANVITEDSYSTSFEQSPRDQVPVKSDEAAIEEKDILQPSVVTVIKGSEVTQMDTIDPNPLFMSRDATSSQMNSVVSEPSDSPQVSSVIHSNDHKKHKIGSISGDK